MYGLHNLELLILLYCTELLSGVGELGIRLPVAQCCMVGWILQSAVILDSHYATDGQKE